ncbi:YcfL family protein [Thaumasiovibrio sp. DFM-14]|uniref:YcfL family protein n=1 Tax=Thaumasiovibrio sp. DFM-14 TaxID=3384792 RepID=UPI00399F10A4
MRWLFIVFAITAMAGCAKSTTGLSIDSQSQSVVLNDFSLSRQLEIDRAMSEHINGLMQAKVPLTSKTNKTLQLQYRFYWYDKHGLELKGSDSPWRLVTIYGKDRVTLEGMAIDIRATQYRVVIREADK